MYWSIIGSSAAVLTTCAFIPQIVKIYRTKSANDVSVLTLLQLSAGVVLWIAYGAYLKNAIIVLANAVMLVSLCVTLALYFRYKRCPKEKNITV